MIQRIQSVYLALGAVCLIYLVFFNSAWQTSATEALAWYRSAVTIVGTATATVALIAIFVYKNRAKQLKLVVALQVMTLGFIVILFGGLFLAGDFDLIGRLRGDAGTWFIALLPIATYLLFYLARRGIQRDINLVKSMDRLR